MSDLNYVLGVDAGASKTHALVIDATGKYIGFGEAGTGNHQVLGLEAALFEIRQAVTKAMQMMAGRPERVELGCFCLAGADLPEDYDMLQEAVERLGLVKSVQIKNDTLAALRSGLSRSWGVVVICGTGFNAAGRSPDGKEIVLPGLGNISGDWGGGHALANEVIRMVMRAWDGRGLPTLLSERVLHKLDTPSIEDLITRLYHDQISSKAILDLVPLLFEVAEEGDKVARTLVVKMGIEVGVTANALIRRMTLNKTDVEVVLAGGVFKGKGHLLLNTVTRTVHEETPRACIIRPQFEPVVGAALLALEGIGVEVNEHHYHQLNQSLPENLLLGRKNGQRENL